MRKIARKLYRAIPFKQPAFETLRRLLAVPEPIYRHLYFQGVIDVPVGQTSFRMRHHGYQIENAVFWSGVFGHWEGPSMRVWVRAAREAHVIFDVGANTGLYALVAKAVAPQATVVAFEPVARVRAKLQENVDLNRFDLEIVPAGMSDRDGVAVMLDSDEEHEISATLDAAGAVQSGRVLREVSVPVARLDTLISAGMLPPPDLLKIDVEGHEGAVLRGMADHLEASRPALLIEVVTSDAADRVDRLIRPFGYLTYRLDQGGPRRLDAVAPTPGTNLFLCTQEAAGRLIQNP